MFGKFRNFLNKHAAKRAARKAFKAFLKARAKERKASVLRAMKNFYSAMMSRELTSPHTSYIKEFRLNFTEASFSIHPSLRKEIFSKIRAALLSAGFTQNYSTLQLSNLKEFAFVVTEQHSCSTRGCQDNNCPTTAGCHEDSSCRGIIVCF